MKLRRVGILFPLLLSLMASAQVGVYGAFSASKANISGGVESSNWLYGGIGGLYFDRGHLAVLETGIDARVVFGYQSKTGDIVNDKVFGGFIGPRLAIKVPVLKPYGEVLVGAARTQGGGQNDTNLPPDSVVSFAYELVAGADLTILPRIDWRVAEYSFTGIPNRSEGRGLSNSATTNAISSGVVIRF